MLKSPLSIFQCRNVFLQDMGAIPLKCDYQGRY